VTVLQARAEQARIRLDAFTAGPVATMRREMAQRAARQSLSRVDAVDATRSSWPSSHVPSILPPVEEEKSYSSEWQQDVPHGVRRLSLTRAIGVAEEKKQSAISTMRTVLHHEEIEQLKRYHDNSLADSTRRAYQSDYDSFVQFLHDRFPRLAIERMQSECTLEHVLSYLNAMCEDGKKISTVNRRLSSIKKHILPGLFTKTAVPGSRQEQMMREVDAIIKGMRRTVGAEHRVRGKKPLLIEDIRAMADVAAKAVDDDGHAMPNKRCRDVALLLFLWHSAMRRNEVVRLRWTDLTFDKRSVVVLIRQSKTDRESNGQTIAIPRLEGAHCCVSALEAWREKSGGAGESPVFRWISKKDEIQWRELIDQRIVAVIKAYCEEVGLDSRLFAGHSTRSGYATSCSDRGVPISEIMKRTRHKAISSVQAYMKSNDLCHSAGDRLL
jgi:integrase